MATASTNEVTTDEERRTIPPPPASVRPNRGPRERGLPGTSDPPTTVPPWTASGSPAGSRPRHGPTRMLTRPRQRLRMGLRVQQRKGPHPHLGRRSDPHRAWCAPRAGGASTTEAASEQRAPLGARARLTSAPHRTPRGRGRLLVVDRCLGTTLDDPLSAAALPRGPEPGKNGSGEADVLAAHGTAQQGNEQEESAKQDQGRDDPHDDRDHLDDDMGLRGARAPTPLMPVPMAHLRRIVGVRVPPSGT
jgi:hypothetical protein